MNKVEIQDKINELHKVLSDGVMWDGKPFIQHRIPVNKIVINKELKELYESLGDYSQRPTYYTQK